MNLDKRLALATAVMALGVGLAGPAQADQPSASTATVTPGGGLAFASPAHATHPEMAGTRSVSTAASSDWQWSWYDSHTPTKHWSTANVSLGPHGSAVAAYVRCTGGGSLRVQIRKAPSGATVWQSRWGGCYGTSYFAKGGLGRKWAYYFHIDVTAKRPLQVEAYRRTW
ncbi:hypothetical protein ACFY3M_51555 [Streptomyces mirabilis]|uniref:hypothetical protein n=1 Tax=Streptomyces mirabilis TaxID=68239 RepID=UPI0036C78CA2